MREGQLADTILEGGRIFLGLAEGFAEHLALADGRVLAAGRREDLVLQVAVEEIDLSDQFEHSASFPDIPTQRLLAGDSA